MFDQYQAWEGVWPGTDEPLYVQAAAYRGKPVTFSILGKWAINPTKTSDGPAQPRPEFGALAFVFWVAMCVIAFRNWKVGIGDRKTAFAVGAVVFALGFIAHYLRASHRPDAFTQMGILVAAIESAGGMAIFQWCVVMAFEPFVRHYFPTMLVSSTRLLRGQFTDPVVGRDVLLGCLIGVLFAGIRGLMSVIGIEPLLFPYDSSLDESRVFLGRCLGSQIVAITASLYFAAHLVIIRFVTRSFWIAVLGATVVHWTFVTFSLKMSATYWGWAGFACFLGLMAFVLIRYGMLAFIAQLSVMSLLEETLTINANAHYFSNTVVVFITVAGLAFYGFYCATGRTSIWRAFDARST